jgi:hypothetical protein
MDCRSVPKSSRARSRLAQQGHGLPALGVGEGPFADRPPERVELVVQHLEPLPGRGAALGREHVAGDLCHAFVGELLVLGQQVWPADRGPASLWGQFYHVVGVEAEAPGGPPRKRLGEFRRGAGRDRLVVQPAQRGEARVGLHTAGGRPKGRVLIGMSGYMLSRLPRNRSGQAC